MRHDTDENKIWVRQSWLNDVMICPERARLGIQYPQYRIGSDATHIGTAVHKGIETILGGASADDGVRSAQDELERLITEEPFRVNSTNGEGEMREHVVNLTRAWVSGILPEVELGGHIEKTFGVPIFVLEDHPDQPEVWLGGTMDYVEPNGTVWDWKTAARKYSQLEKQKQSIQATAYVLATHAMGLGPLPTTFKYGVVTRTSNPVAQVVPIVRTQAHVDWFKQQVYTVVDSYFHIGLLRPWMANDQHNLCSEKWCPYWSICKGSRLSDFDNTNTKTTEEVNK